MARNEDRDYMIRALALAERGRGYTSPNPAVGAVIVSKGEVVAEGYHRQAGQAHAEAAALKKAGAKAKGATLYVTLEPCCHFGSTPPCTDAIIKAEIARVVYAVGDPDGRVAGRGARMLRRHGIEVKSGVLKKEALAQNEAYFHFKTYHRPFVILKLAQSLDGRIATSVGDSKWITGKEARKQAHQLRAFSDAVVVGAGTVRQDDPSLTVRHVKGRDPYRIVVTSSGKLPAGAKLFKANEDHKTIVAAPSAVVKKLSDKHIRNGVTFWEVSQNSQKIAVGDLLLKAGEFGIQSMLVEGGGELATAFLKSGLVDKVAVFVAPMIIGAGTDAVGNLDVKKIEKALKLERVEVTPIGNDVLVTGYPVNAGKK